MIVGEKAKKGVKCSFASIARLEWGNVKAIKVLCVRTALFKPEVDR